MGCLHFYNFSVFVFDETIFTFIPFIPLYITLNFK